MSDPALDWSHVIVLKEVRFIDHLSLFHFFIAIGFSVGFTSVGFTSVGFTSVACQWMCEITICLGSL